MMRIKVLNIYPWINDSTAISVSWWEYDINWSRIYTSAAWTVNNGDIVSVKNNSSSSVWATTNTTLTIGGISDTYSVTTIPPDTTPDTFVLDDVSNATLDTLYSSNPVTISGINTSTSISISGWEYSIQLRCS